MSDTNVERTVEQQLHSLEVAVNKLQYQTEFSLWALSIVIGWWFGQILFVFFKYARTNAAQKYRQ